MLPSTSTGLGVKNDLNINVQRTVVWVFNGFWNNEAPSSTHPLGARRRSRSRDRDRRRASPPPADWRGPTGPTGPTDYRPPPTEWAGMAGFAVRKMWFFWFVYFLCLCMPCGELQFCVVILSNKCFFLNDVFAFLIDVHLCIWGMRRRATWDGHRLNAPACIGPQARAMSVVVSPCFSILILHDTRLRPMACASPAGTYGLASTSRGTRREPPNSCFFIAGRSS